MKDINIRIALTILMSIQSVFGFSQIDTLSFIKNAERMKPLAGTSIKIKHLKDVEGKRIDFSSFQGKIILLSFWSPKCGSCLLQNFCEPLLFERLKCFGIDDNIQLIKICTRVDYQQWKTYLNTHDLMGVQLFYEGNIDKQFSKWKLAQETPFPQYWIINENGKLLGVDISVPEEIGTIDYLIYKATKKQLCSEAYLQWFFSNRTNRSPEDQEFCNKLNPYYTDFRKKVDEFVEIYNEEQIKP